MYQITEKQLEAFADKLCDIIEENSFLESGISGGQSIGIDHKKAIGNIKRTFEGYAQLTSEGVNNENVARPV